MVQNLSERIVFQEKFEFLKSGIWFQLYASSDKDTFFDSFGTEFHISNFGVVGPLEENVDVFSPMGFDV